MDAEAFEEVQSEVMDLRTGAVAEIESHLDCAETCESVTDMAANLSEAIKSTIALLDKLRELRKRVK